MLHGRAKLAQGESVPLLYFWDHVVEAILFVVCRPASYLIRLAHLIARLSCMVEMAWFSCGYHAQRRRVFPRVQQKAKHQHTESLEDSGDLSEMSDPS